MIHFPVPSQQLDDKRRLRLNHGKTHREGTLTANLPPHFIPSRQEEGIINGQFAGGQEPGKISTDIAAPSDQCPLFPKADIRVRQVRFAPLADSCAAAKIVFIAKSGKNT